ncbi:MAG: MFS transporter [Syntrophobacter sp.]
MDQITRRIPYRWVVAFILFFCYSIQYLDRVKTTVLNPAIMKDIGLTTSDIGTGAFLMMIFYGPAQLVAGILTDKFGAKRILIFSVIAWSFMTAWMGFLQTPLEYFYRMALFGLLIGTEYVPSARILMRWFPKEGRARAQAMLSWAWIITPAWASIVATQLAVYFDSWRPVFFLTAAMGIIPLFLLAIYIFNRPEEYKNITREELEYSYQDELEEGILKKDELDHAQARILAQSNFSFFGMFKNSSYLAVIIVNIVMQITLWGTLVWIPLYLSDTFSFKLSTMGFWSGLYFAAGALGSFAGSYISDRLFRNNRKIMILACFICLIPFVLLLSSLKAADPSLLAFALCGMGFFANMAWGPQLTLPAEIFSPEVYGKAMGFVSGSGYFVAAFATKIFGMLVTVHENGTKDYHMGWIFIAICAVAGIVAASFIKPYKSAKPAFEPVVSVGKA